MKTVTILKDGAAVANVWNANYYFARLRGLLGRTLTEEGGLLLTPCGRIHTFFMRYAIDAVYLDRAGLVLRVDEALAPGKSWPAQRGAKCVLELPAGAAAKRKIRAGDRLEVAP